MEVQAKRPTTKGPDEWFTGEVWVDPIAQNQGPSPISLVSVHFTPCAHTAWHRHTLGQTLYVNEGQGFVQARGGPLTRIRPGDIVRRPSEHGDACLSHRLVAHQG
jgi:quercetin dioxygenase-like cupin family protein